MNHDAYPDRYIREILSGVKSIAMVGASPVNVRPSYFAFKYLAQRGYDMIPVNPGHVGKSLLGKPFVASLSDIGRPVDMIDIFRSSSHIMPVVDEALKLTPLPRVIWMQLGARDDAAAAKAEAAGLKVVMNRCPKIEYGRLSSEISWMGVNSRTRSSRRAPMPPQGVRPSLKRTRRGAVGTTTRLAHRKGSSNDWFTVFPNARFPELFAEVHRVLKKNAHFYLYCDQETAFVAKPVGEAAGFKFWKPLVWDKCLHPDTPVWTGRGTIADGIAVKHPGELTMSILSELLDDIVHVEDEEVSEAITVLLERAKLVVEGAGAASVAALLAGKVGGSGGVCTLLSGGNIDPTMLISVMRYGLTHAGRRFEVARGPIPRRQSRAFARIGLDIGATARRDQQQAS